MASVIFGRLVGLLDADDNKWKKGVKSAKHETEGLKDSIEHLHHVLEGIGAVFVFEKGLEGLKEGVEFVKKWGEYAAETLHQSAELAEQMEKLGRISGSTAEDWLTLKGSAVLTNTDFEAFTAGVVKLSAGLVTAAETGKGPAAEALDKLHLSAAKLINLPLPERLAKIGDALNGLGTADEKIQAIKGLAGKGGAELLPFLLRGSEGIHQLSEELKKLGYSMSEIEFGDLGRAGEDIKKMKLAIEGIKLHLSADIAPVVSIILEDFTEWYTGTKKVASGIDGISQNTLALIMTLAVAKQAMIEFRGAAKFGAGIAGQALGVPGAGLLPPSGVTDMLHPAIGGPGEVDKFMTEYIERINKMHEEIAKHKPKGGIPFDEDALERQGKKLKEIITPIEKLTNSIGELSQSLYFQIETFGMSSEAAKLYELQVKRNAEADLDGKKVKDDDIEFAKKQIAQLEELKRKKKDQEEADKKLQEFLKNIETPLDKYNDKMREADNLLFGGKITEGQYRAAAKKAQEELDSANKKEHKGEKEGPQFAKTLLVGSTEEYNARIRAMFGGDKRNDPTEKVANNTSNMVEILTRLGVTLEDIYGLIDAGVLNFSDLA